MQKLHTIKSDPYGVGKIAIHPFKTWIANSNPSAGGINIWNLVTAERIHHIETDDDVIIALAFSPDGNTLAGGGKSTDIKFWNTDNWELDRSFRGHTRRIMDVVFSPDGECIASNSLEESIRIWRVRDGEVIAVLPYGLSMAFHPTQEKLAVLDLLKAYQISFYALQSGRIIESNNVPDMIEFHLAFSPDGNLFASQMKDGTIGVFQTAGIRVERIINIRDTARCPIFSPDGTILAAAYQDSAMIGFWEVETGLQLATAKGEFDTPSSLAFSPDGAYIACGSGGIFGGGLVEVWKIEY